MNIDWQLVCIIVLGFQVMILLPLAYLSWKYDVTISIPGRHRGMRPGVDYDHEEVREILICDGGVRLITLPALDYKGEQVVDEQGQLLYEVFQLILNPRPEDGLSLFEVFRLSEQEIRQRNERLDGQQTKLAAIPDEVLMFLDIEEESAQRGFRGDIKYQVVGGTYPFPQTT